jgi:hypothetical protein
MSESEFDSGVILEDRKSVRRAATLTSEHKANISSVVPSAKAYAMSKESRRISMKLRGFNKQPLITEELALEIAKLVFIREFGHEDFELQQPLTVQDEGDTWVIEGSREYNEDAPRVHYQLVDGRTLIEIAKENGAILALERFSAFAETSGPPPAEP